MKTLIEGATICYPGHAQHGKRVNILIENDHVKSIGQEIIKGDVNRIGGKNLMVFPSFVDMQCASGEPGHEYKESLDSLANAAKAGGFSTVVVLPSTLPPIDNAATLVSSKSRASHLNVQVLFYGSISKGLAGKELSEMADMQAHGAVGFTDAKHCVRSAGLMKLAMEYAHGLNAMVCSLPYDDELIPGAQVHEGPHNTTLGLKSAPHLAEEITLQRDLSLLAYTNTRMHVATISSSPSIQMIADAKAKGLKLSSGVALANLLYNDQVLANFETVYKTLPHLREETDRQALLEGVKSGVIDVIVTDHTPEDVENKDIEFDHASIGMTMLETALPLINTRLIPNVGWDVIVDAMAIRPRRILGLNPAKLEVGSKFDCIVFDPDFEWTYDDRSRNSKSSNSPVYGKMLKGKVVF